jgi:hypothetical protein
MADSPEVKAARLALKAQKEAASAAKFAARVASGQWEREVAEDRGRPADFGHMRATCAEK